MDHNIVVKSIILSFALLAISGETPLRAGGWLDRVAETQAMQPHWITPLATVTPRLEQEFRFDMVWQGRASNGVTNMIGNGKGLELIPTERTEVILGIPSYNQHQPNTTKNGFFDEPVLLKYRLFSQNEEHGSSIVTLFFGATFPTGSVANTNQYAVVTPTLAAGKGWGPFDIQSTVGKNIATSHADKVGESVVFNTAVQYRAAQYLWPELEVNLTHWTEGVRAGNQQVFLTPGIVLGKIPLWNRLGLTIGTGVQIATTHYYATNHNWILSLRLPF
jgi:hypothetical protein